MSSVFVPQHIRGNKGQVTPETIQKLLDENSHLIQCIVENQNTGNIRESTQYQQVLHRNLVWLATVADSNQSNPQSLMGSPKQLGLGGMPSQPTKIMRSETAPLSTMATGQQSATGLSPTLQKPGTPRPNGPVPSTPQPNRSSPQTKPAYSAQQPGYLPQYRNSPNSAGSRTPMRSPIDPGQQHTPVVQRQSALVATAMPPQYPQQQAMPGTQDQQPAASYSQQTSSYPKPQNVYNQQQGQQPTASYAQPASSYPQPGSYPQPPPTTYSQAPGYVQTPVSYPQQQPGTYTQHQGPFTPRPNSYPANATGGPQGQPPVTFPQSAPPQPQYPSAPHQVALQGQPRPYYGRPGPPPASGGYPAYPAQQNQQIPPPTGQQMPQYHQQQPTTSYAQQYGSQPQPLSHYNQTSQQVQQPQQGMPY